MSGPSRQASIDACFEQLASGDETALDRLLPHIYEDLRSLAAAVFRGSAQRTLQPTVLVHEAWLRLSSRGNGDGFSGRKHFLRVAAIAMRQLLADHARRRRALRRGGAQEQVELLDDMAWTEGSEPIDVVALDDALARLQQVDERLARVVELRFFAGLTHEETAEVLGIAPRTARLDWQMARSWLRRALDGR